MIGTYICIKVYPSGLFVVICTLKTHIGEARQFLETTKMVSRAWNLETTTMGCHLLRWSVIHIIPDKRRCLCLENTNTSLWRRLLVMTNNLRSSFLLLSIKSGNKWCYETRCCWSVHLPCWESYSTCLCHYFGWPDSFSGAKFVL